MRGIFVRWLELLSWLFIGATILAIASFVYGIESQTHTVGRFLYQSFARLFGSPESAIVTGQILSIFIGLFIGFLVSVLIFGVLFVLMDIREFTKRIAEQSAKR